MDDIPSPVLSLHNSDASQWNKDLLLAFQAELERNPEADLLSMFPRSYHREHQNSQYHELSDAGKFNLRTLHELHSKLKHDPELDIPSRIPKNYSRRRKMAIGPEALPPPAEEVKDKKEKDFRTRLETAEIATIVFPLSEEVTTLLAQHSNKSFKEEPGCENIALSTSLKQLLWNSPKLWESHFRGVVVRCSGNVVAKVVTGSSDYTEYTSMQFLAEKAPSVPAPRVHGLIALKPFLVTFMSFISEITLAKVWPTLSHEGKLSIQQQLEDIFRRIRSLRQDNGKAIGGVCGEGAKELRVDECALFKNITTAESFSNLQFSARHYGSDTYVKLLRSFLDHDVSSSTCELVFTHGDVRMENIMVKKDTSIKGYYLITGIIDWEDSGFYPPYYESTTLTRTMSLTDEDDWYNYLPRSISPSKFPVRWLVDRLWGIHLRT